MSYISSKRTIVDTGNNDGASVHDVQQALGITSNQLKDLCTNSNINKWTKFKPISATGVTPLESRTWENGYLQSGRAYGIEGKFYQSTTLANFIVQMYNILYNTQDDYYPNGYIYHKPEGTIESPYRLSDFAISINDKVGYYHDAYLMASFQDSNSNWHQLTLFSNVVEGEGETKRVPYPEDNTVIESSASIADCWDNYEHNKPLANLTWPYDACVKIQDILYALCPNKTTLKSLTHGILFIPYGTTEPAYCRMVLGSFPEKTTTQSELDSSETYGYVEFYTDISGSGFVSPSSVTGNHLFLPMPCCYGTMEFYNTGGGGGRFVILSSTASWVQIDGVWAFDMGATVNVNSFSYYDGGVYLKVGEYDDTGGSSIQVTENRYYSVHTIVSGNNGDTRYLKLVGVRNGEATKLYSESFTLDGKPENS